VLEVDVPVLSHSATVDPFIESLQTEVMGNTHYLQTSPEFFLKRLLAAYCQDVYSLGKAFRQDEKGHRHNPEFTMLEWYRMGWDEQQLIEEVKQLIQQCMPEVPYQKFSYRELFDRYLALDPHTASLGELQTRIEKEIETSFALVDKNTCLDVLFTHCVEANLPKDLVAIDDYPASQAALARIAEDASGQPVAKRFEMYLNGIELANGYWELADGDEQEKRFIADTHYRQENHLPSLPYAQELVHALKEGSFPECAGVALGVDRLLMACLGKSDIREVLSFV